MIFFFIFWFQCSATYIALEEPKRTVQNYKYLKIPCQSGQSVKVSVQGFKTRTRAVITPMKTHLSKHQKNFNYKNAHFLLL